MFKKQSVFIIMLCISLVVSANDEALLPDKNLVAFWHFDQIKKGMLVNTTADSGQYNLLAEVVGTGKVAVGRSKNSIQFDGKSYIRLTGSLAKEKLNFDKQSFTLSAWICPESLISIKTIFENRDAAGIGYHLAIINKKLVLQLADQMQVKQSITSELDIVSEKWQHVVAVVDRSSTHMTVRLYINGEHISSNEMQKNMSSINNVDEIFFIGKNRNISSANFIGKIDEVKIFNVALNPEQVKTVKSKVLPDI